MCNSMKLFLPFTAGLSALGHRTAVSAALYPDLDLPLLAAAIGAFMFLARLPAESLRKRDYREDLGAACDKQLAERRKELLEGAAVSDFGSPFIAIRWNVDTYGETLRVGRTKRGHAHPDLGDLVAFMEQDNEFQSESWRLYGDGSDLNELAAKRNMFQKTMQETIDAMPNRP